MRSLSVGVEERGTGLNFIDVCLLEICIHFPTPFHVEFLPLLKRLNIIERRGHNLKTLHYRKIVSD